jgi:hypothetical protein
MPTRLEKLLWSVLAGTAIGLAGCHESGDRGPDDAAVDSESDAEDAAEDAAEDPVGDMEEEEVIMDLYGPPAYVPSV